MNPNPVHSEHLRRTWHAFPSELKRALAATWITRGFRVRMAVAFVEFDEVRWAATLSSLPEFDAAGVNLPRYLEAMESIKPAPVPDDSRVHILAAYYAYSSLVKHWWNVSDEDQRVTMICVGCATAAALCGAGPDEVELQKQDVLRLARDQSQ